MELGVARPDGLLFAPGRCARRPGLTPPSDRIDPGDVLPLTAVAKRPAIAALGAAGGCRGRPPLLLSVPCARSLRTRLRNAREQGADLRLAVPAVTAESADGRELASLGPSCDGLGIHAEHRGDLCRCQQRFSFGRACRHVYGLSSWTSTADLAC